MLLRFSRVSLVLGLALVCLGVWAEPQIIIRNKNDPDNIQVVTCDQTLNAGSDVDAVVAAVANGTTTTICLNSGTYSGSQVNFANITRTGGFITVRSSSGIGATLSGSNVFNTDYMKFDSLTLSDMTVSGCSTNIHLLNSTFVANNPGVDFNDINDQPCPADQAMIVDRVNFAGVDQTGCEGRLCVRGSNGLIIRNSFFGNNGNGDGIQVAAGGSNVTIGPGNVFSDVDQIYCDGLTGAHCDAIQVFCTDCTGLVITQNYFENNDTMILALDEVPTGLIIEHNLMDGRLPARGSSRIQPAPCTDCIERHNTVIHGSFGFTNLGFVGLEGVNSTNALVENNIIVGGNTIDTSGCTGCTYRYNLFNNSGNQVGTNVVIGSPVWTGGTYPTIPSTWAAFLLAGGSPGKSAGNDGNDMGVTFYGAGGWGQ